MFWSGSLLWICLALCVAAGGSETFYRRSGQQVVMDCGDVDLSARSYVEWRYDNDFIIKTIPKTGSTSRGRPPLAKRVKLDGVKLKIPAVELGDSGDYSCSGKDERWNRITRQHTLHVVSVSVSPAESVLISTDVTLRCEVGGDPAAQVQWMKPPGVEPYGSSGNTVTLKSVTSADAGQWSCVIRDSTGKEVERIGQSITVVGSLTSPEEVTAPLGGAAELPCFLPDLRGLCIVGGGWMRDPPTGLHFPTLSNVNSLHWSDSRVSPRVEFSRQRLTTNFTVTLKDVESADAGVYVCTVEFDGGYHQTRTHLRSLRTRLKLKVEEEEVDEPAAGSGFWEKPVLGVALWLWFAAAASVGLIYLVVIVVVILRRRTRGRQVLIKLAHRHRFPGRTEWLPQPPRHEDSAANEYVFM